MVIVHKQNIADMLLMEILAELHQIREKLRFFEEKYSQNFEEFSLKIESEKENFEHFDDYMEWKAYKRILSDLEEKVEDLRHGKLQVA